MQEAVNYLRGTVRVLVRMRYPERFFNICAERGLEFWDVKNRPDGALEVSVPLKDYGKLKRLGKTCGFTAETLRRRGVPVLARRFRKRYLLLAGLLLCFGLVWLSSFYVWDIEVSGNKTVTDDQILEALDGEGVRVGMCRLNYDQDKVSNDMLLKLTKLCWLTVNIHGSKADVLVREERDAPELVDNTRNTVVCARKAGVVTKILAANGKTLVAVGDTVAAGDLLVTGEMESKSCGTRYVNASAEVWARTWYTLSETAPLQRSEKQFTGERKNRFALVIAGRRINFYINSGNVYAECDKIISEKPLTLFGTVFPVTAVKETYSEYTLSPVSADPSAEEKRLEQALTERIQGSIDGEITKITFHAVVENGAITVTADAECSEQIAAARDMTLQDTTDTGETADG